MSFTDQLEMIRPHNGASCMRPIFAQIGSLETLINRTPVPQLLTQDAAAATIVSYIDIQLMGRPRAGTYSHIGPLRRQFFILSKHRTTLFIAYISRFRN